MMYRDTRGRFISESKFEKLMFKPKRSWRLEEINDFWRLSWSYIDDPTWDRALQEAAFVDNSRGWQ
jgi:hypothetical protein